MPTKRLLRYDQATGKTVVVEITKTPDPVPSTPPRQVDRKLPAVLALIEDRDRILLDASQSGDNKDWSLAGGDYGLK